MKSMICTETITCRIVVEVHPENVVIVMEEEAWEPRGLCLHSPNPKAATY
jgi:hypothetical protein